MQDAKQQIETQLKHNRPNLSPSSVNTYTIILASIYKKVFGSEDFDISLFNKEADKVLEHLKETNYSTRKTKLACLFVLSKNDKYQHQMVKDIGSYNEDLSKQEKNDKQTASWVNTDQLKTKYNELKHTADLLYKKQSHTPSDIQNIQDYIIIKRPKDKGNLVVLSQKAFNSIEETIYLLSSPNNKKHLLESIQELNEGKTTKIRP